MIILKRIVIVLVLLLIIVGVVVYFYLRSLTPDYNKELRLQGLKSPVEVLYDNYAIPHIYAQDEEDLFYAFGYVHAQDRLFQMEILRRLADGRLSEVFGEKALQSDKFFRMLSFREQAKTTLASVYKDSTAPFVKAAKAYLKGINEYIRSGKTPVEFTLSGIPKTPFTLEDMEIIVGYMGYTFVGAFKTESIATTIATKLGKDYLDDVMHNWPDTAFKIPVRAAEPYAVTSAAKTLTYMANRLDELSTDLPYPPFTGSNGWLISGKKTKSGKPILSNDTHIAFSQPSIWYEAYLECPGFNIYGNFLAGTPMPALGHSDKGGWGITMFENDDADFFRERINPHYENQVWYKDHWEDLLVRKELIKIKGKSDFILEVKKSKHGYIMNGAFDGVKDITEPIALWWVYHQFPSRHLQVFYNLSHAANDVDAAKAVEPLISPGLNFIWADTSGNIAWWAAGKIPVRPAHVNPQLILDGSTGADDPTGWQWKKVHTIEHKHPLGILPVAGKWFNVGPIAVNGGQETINNFNFLLDSSGLYKVSSGPALRRVIDLGDRSQQFSVNPTGQSGYFMSPHYDDQAQMFAEGGKRPELTNRKSVEKGMIGKTILKP